MMYHGTAPETSRLWPRAGPRLTQTIILPPHLQVLLRVQSSVMDTMSSLPSLRKQLTIVAFCRRHFSCSSLNMTYSWS